MASLLIIANVPYTEIDWEAYMEEVSGALAGERDYLNLRGGTGPLVYPAGFVYLYSLLYRLTSGGANIRLAQYLFALLHAGLLALVLAVYRAAYRDAREAERFPILMVCSLLLSRRVASLFVLRLFNDGPQMVLMYLAVLLFAHGRWSIGCLVYSLSVSVKMNGLLFAPGVALLMVQARGMGGMLWRVFTICGGTQVALGMPFLAHAAWSYVGRAFEFSREFLHKWSVNGAFLDEETFVGKPVAGALLLAHLGALLAFGQLKWTVGSEGGLLGLLGMWGRRRALRKGHVVRVLLTCNFLGIVFARTLHYQFYLWYAHSVPLLVWQAGLWWPVGVGIVMGVEVVFNVYPPRAWAALLLHAAHMTLLVALWTRSQATAGEVYEAERRKENVDGKAT